MYLIKKWNGEVNPFLRPIFYDAVQLNPRESNTIPLGICVCQEVYLVN